MADKPIKPTVSFTPITEVDKKKLRNKTAFSLPDNPTARGMKPNEIKKYLYSAIIDFDNDFLSKHPSVIGIIETLISDTITAFNTSDSYLQAVIEYIEGQINDINKGLEEEIQATNERIDNINTNIATIESDIDNIEQEVQTVKTDLNTEVNNRQTALEDLLSLITSLQNAGYITKEVSDLVNYYTKTETFSKAEILAMHEELAGLGISFKQVPSLPITGEHKVIYLVPSTEEDNNVFDEYIWLEVNGVGKYERIGSTKINLADYYTKLQIDALLKNYAPKHWEGTRQEFEEAQDSIAVGTICIITESNGDVTIETKTAILGKAVLGQMILGKGE